jgi:hypothetical protein
MYIGIVCCLVGVGGCSVVDDWRMIMEFTVMGYVGLVLVIAGLIVRLASIK